jgi:hypothetical protein
MSTVPQVQSDQFAQTPFRGDLDLSIMHAGVIVGTVYSATPTDTFAAGARVKLDVTVTTPGSLPRFVAAADNEAAFGTVKRTPQKALFVVGDVVEVCMGGAPTVQWQVAGATITPALSVGLSSGFVVAADGSHTAMGIALDYATDSTMLRVITGYVAC